MELGCGGDSTSVLAGEGWGLQGSYLCLLFISLNWELFSSWGLDS